MNFSCHLLATNCGQGTSVLVGHNGYCRTSAGQIPKPNCIKRLGEGFNVTDVASITQSSCEAMCANTPGCHAYAVQTASECTIYIMAHAWAAGQRNCPTNSKEPQIGTVYTRPHIITFSTKN